MSRLILACLTCWCLAMPLAGQEVVTYWNGYEWLEGEVAQELWVRPNYQAGAEALLVATGNGDFIFDGINTCGLDAMVFTRNDASGTPVPSGTPVLEVSRRLGFELHNHFKWLIEVDGAVPIEQFYVSFVDGVSAEQAQALLGELGAGEIVATDTGTPPLHTVIHSSRSGTVILEHINALRLHPQVVDVYPFLASGCPSGGGGPGIPAGPPSVLQIPTLDRAGLLLMILGLTMAALMVQRSGRRHR